ncbi:MAG: fused MFS/spermidine synthase [Spirochaetaceae bacterium]|nr:fused MFS/spermidine synthase [Spirochaetaceae bacterium]
MVALFVAAAFLGAAMLFLIEPMLAKLLLPSFGGSPTVWSTSTLFFQGVLLAGYVYVHVSTRRLGPRRQPWAHLALLVLPLLLLPVGLPSDAEPPVGSDPVWWLLRVLLVAIGLPFALLAATGPLLQRWFSWTAPPRARAPYFLYAASNVGSVVGLLGYPFLVEPTVGLATQTRWWSIAYVGFALLVAACGVVAGRAARRTPESGPADVTAVASRPGPSVRTRLRWVAVAFLPSSLMLGVTTHVSTDIAAIPLFWTVPLVVYLATFVVAFGRSTRRPPRRTALLAAALCLPVLLVVAGTWDVTVWAAVVLDLSLLAAAGLAAHGRLAATRPVVEHLTGFYILVSLGGALGGLLNGLLAPLLLDRPLEYPVVVALVPLLTVGILRDVPRPRRRPVLGLAREPMAWMAAVLVVGFIGQEYAGGRVLLRERTFFGSYQVKQDEDRRLLSHGTTAHGWEERAGPWVGEPTSYYTRSGPIGNVMSAYRGTPLLDRVAVIGMGVGTMAAYGEPGRRMAFYEIDPAVVDIARSSFGFLRRSEADVRVVVGDGRLALGRAPDSAYGLIVVDAFSSDAIPAHLLTEEAVRGYRSKLAPGGLLAVHVTNRHLDLVPVLAAQARRLQMVAVVRNDDDAELPASISTWVVLARRDADLDRLRTRPDWDPAVAGDTRAWTDDYSSLLEVLDIG